MLFVCFADFELCLCRLAIAKDQRCELSRGGYSFFTELFRVHDKDMDGALSPSELEELFATAPQSPWEGSNLADMTAVNEAGWITLKGWLALWRCDLFIILVSFAKFFALSAA